MSSNRVCVRSGGFKKMSHNFQQGLEKNILFCCFTFLAISKKIKWKRHELVESFCEIYKYKRNTSVFCCCCCLQSKREMICQLTFKIHQKKVWTHLSNFILKIQFIHAHDVYVSKCSLFHFSYHIHILLQSSQPKTTVLDSHLLFTRSFIFRSIFC